MRTFEFDDGKSSKFWNITLTGSSFTVNFGKKGASGQTQTKTFANASTAQKEHDKLVAEKLKKGYVETTAGASVAPPVSAVATQMLSAMERALIENPEDLASHMAFADYLHDQGDPRGDFIQVQLALEDPKLDAAARKPLQAREKELLKKHERTWLGPMAAWWLDNTEPIHHWRRQSGYYYEHIWRRGWIDELRIETLSNELAQAVVQQQHLLRLLRVLRLLQRDYDNPGFATLLQGTFFSNVRILQIGSDSDQCYMEGENTVELVSRMPKLEQLHTYARRVDSGTIFSMNLPHLRQLTIHHIHSYPLERLAANASLKNLTHLAFWPHGLEPDDEAAYITPEGAQAVFRSPHLNNLQHLMLRLSDLGDEGIRALVESGKLKHLKTLDLLGGCVTDAGARMLAECPDLRNLDKLNLSSNMITEEGLALLRATGVNLESGHQYDPAGVHDDEREYLWEGDAE